MTSSTYEDKVSLILIFDCDSLTDHVIYSPDMWGCSFSDDQNVKENNVAFFF